LDSFTELLKSEQMLFAGFPSLRSHRRNSKLWAKSWSFRVDLRCDPKKMFPSSWGTQNRPTARKNREGQQSVCAICDHQPMKKKIQNENTCSIANDHRLLQKRDSHSLLSFFLEIWIKICRSLKRRYKFDLKSTLLNIETEKFPRNEGEIGRLFIGKAIDLIWKEGDSREILHMLLSSASEYKLRQKTLWSRYAIVPRNDREFWDSQ
jgi:hypothetical protein